MFWVIATFECKQGTVAELVNYGHYQASRGWTQVRSVWTRSSKHSSKSLLFRYAVDSSGLFLSFWSTAEEKRRGKKKKSDYFTHLKKLERINMYRTMHYVQCRSILVRGPHLLTLHTYKTGLERFVCFFPCIIWYVLGCIALKRMQIKSKCICIANFTHSCNTIRFTNRNIRSD